MNEVLLRELARQAYEQTPLIVANPQTGQPEHKIGNGGVPMYHQVFNQEKFAELIVRECLSIVENNNPRPPGTTIMYSLDKDEYFDTGWQVAVETKSKQIKQHFGVE